MSFKATGVIAEDAFRQIRREAAAFRAFAVGRLADMQAPTCNATTVLATMERSRSVLLAFGNLVSTPGLEEHAKSQVNDPAYDIVAEFQAMRAAIVELRDSINALFPRDANGFLSYQTTTADATIGTRTFTSAQVSSLVPLLEAVIAAIE